MRFQQLLDAIAGELVHRPADDAEIRAPITEDSRAVEAGGVFVARKGPNVDAHQYISSAVARGAAAVVGELPPNEVMIAPVPYAQVRDAQQSLGELAAVYYGHPSRQLVVIGVTGTDGKTTTTTLIFNILKTSAVRAGMISTVSAVIGNNERDTGLHVTTPGAPEAHGGSRHSRPRFFQRALTASWSMKVSTPPPHATG